MDQQLDSHSCGPATLSTIAHVALGEESWTQDQAPRHRKTWFLHVSGEFATYPPPPPHLDGDARGPLSEPSAPQFSIFDIDPEELLEDEVEPVLLSTSSRIKTNSPPSSTPVVYPSKATESSNSVKPDSRLTSGNLPTQATTPVKRWLQPVNPPPLCQGAIPFLRIPRDAWLAQENLSKERSAADRDDARDKGALEKERLRLASQRWKTVRKQD